MKIYNLSPCLISDQLLALSKFLILQMIVNSRTYPNAHMQVDRGPKKPKDKSTRTGMLKVLLDWLKILNSV